jgi:AAA domain, putative AbiEii toxin, Type IV TA system
MPFELQIPTSDGLTPITLTEGASTHFVGANGSGKTRLAVYIENMLGDKAHRISAHRALNLNPGVAKINESRALKGLRFGYADDAGGLQHRPGNRWGHQKEATGLLNDFDFLLQALFAEQTRTALGSHKKSYEGKKFNAVATKFQQLEEIWKALLPTRILIVEGDDIKVRMRGSRRTYNASGMSDGERAIFYLIGQSLVAEKDSVLVIDEPELHVHRSIMSKLWDHLESARRDCAFVFITHDLEFAAARVGQKFIIQDYSQEGPAWKISIVPEDTGFSEELTTLLLGSRHPVLFVEGEKKSLDMALYRVTYPGWTIVPRGSCQSVIHAVSTFRSNHALTRIRCAGIIDADDYNADDIALLGAKGVFVLPVAEVENLFLLPSITKEIAALEHLSAADSNERTQQLYDDILATVREDREIDKIVLRHVIRRIDKMLKRVDLEGSVNIDALAELYLQKTQNLDIQALAHRRRAEIDRALNERDITLLLALVDNKGMLAKAAARLRNTRLESFEAWLTRVLLTTQGKPLVAALQSVLPAIIAERERPQARRAGSSPP